MECKKCGSNKLNQLFEIKTRYKEIDEGNMTDNEKNEYHYRKYIMEESIEELCKEYSYIYVTREIKGMMCEACNVVNIVENKKYYNDDYDKTYVVENIIYPTKDMQKRYNEKVKLIPNDVYKNYIRAMEADSDDKDIALILLRKTLETILKDKNINGKNLLKKINNIKDKLDVIESEMHEVRKAGNIGAHENKINYTDDEIEAMTDKVEKIIKLFYDL